MKALLCYLSEQNNATPGQDRPLSSGGDNEVSPPSPSDSRFSVFASIYVSVLYHGQDHPFFHHYQGSIDFNTVNIHRTVGMYFLISTGNSGDIE